MTRSLARDHTEGGSGLGVHRRLMERTLSWEHPFRRLAIRLDRLPKIQTGFRRTSCLVRLRLLQ